MATKNITPDLPLDVQNELKAMTIPDTPGAAIINGKPTITPDVMGVGNIAAPFSPDASITTPFKIDTPPINFDETKKTVAATTPTAQNSSAIQTGSSNSSGGGLPWWAALTGLIEAGAKGLTGDKSQTALSRYAEDQARRAEQSEAFRNKYLAGMSKANSANMTTPVGGYARIPGVDVSPAVENKAADLAGAKDGFNIAMNKLQNTLQTYGKGTLLPSAQNEALQSARADVISSIKGMKQLGTLDAGVEKLVAKYLPETGGVNTLLGSNKDQLLNIVDDMRSQQNKAIAAQMQRYGFMETGTPAGASPQSQTGTVSFMVDGKQYNIPADKVQAFMAAKPNAKKL